MIRYRTGWQSAPEGAGAVPRRAPLNCHVVRWLGEGKGVVFKAGPGPLAEVGRLGVKGKTPCEGCGCIKPPRVVELLQELAARKASPSCRSWSQWRAAVARRLGRSLALPATTSGESL